MNSSHRLVLASGSPRRRKILSELGVPFDVLKTDAPEVSIPEDPVRTVTENARAKLLAAQKQVAVGTPVLAADTIVWFANRIYGKPHDLVEAAAFLRGFSGQTHSVFTGLAYSDATGRIQIACERADVTFKTLDEKTISLYLEIVNPIDRAGAYDIDTRGDLLIARYAGSYENIMGLPKEPLARLGITNPDGPDDRPPRTAGTRLAPRS